MTGAPRIAVLDYGIGNLRSAEKALQHVGAAARLVDDAPSVAAADAVVLPGVGAFGACARALRESGLQDAALAAVDGGVPFFGVCVGFQLLYEGSVESPGAAGLGIFPGVVASLPDGVKHPQMQWNILEVRGSEEPEALRGLGPRPWVYFVHSFAPPVGDETVAVCDYGGKVAALVARGVLWGAQFHPEKSGATGLALLANFVRAAKERGGVMELLPAIDLRAGTAVRLTQGDFAREDRYGDPAALAASFIAGGTRWIHVVDLDGARTGVPHERAVLAQLVGLSRGAGVSVEFGGGIRSEDDAEEVLDSGVTRVVLGTAALEEPALAGRCARRWPGRIAVGLDYRVGEDGVAEAQAQGWLAGSGQSVTDLLELWEKEPIGAVVATSVARDGMLAGPDLAGLRALLAATALPVVASGGVSGIEDLVALAGLEAEGRRLAGAIAGKAIVEGRFSVEEGVAACAASA